MSTTDLDRMHWLSRDEQGSIPLEPIARDEVIPAAREALKLLLEQCANSHERREVLRGSFSAHGQRVSATDCMLHPTSELGLAERNWLPRMGQPCGHPDCGTIAVMRTCTRCGLAEPVLDCEHGEPVIAPDEQGEPLCLDCAQ